MTFNNVPESYKKKGAVRKGINFDVVPYIVEFLNISRPLAKLYQDTIKSTSESSKEPEKEVEEKEDVTEDNGTSEQTDSPDMDTDETEKEFPHESPEDAHFRSQINITPISINKIKKDPP